MGNKQRYTGFYLGQISLICRLNCYEVNFQRRADRSSNAVDESIARAKPKIPSC